MKIDLGIEILIIFQFYCIITYLLPLCCQNLCNSLIFIKGKNVYLWKMRSVLVVCADCISPGNTVLHNCHFRGSFMNKKQCRCYDAASFINNCLLIN